MADKGKPPDAAPIIFDGVPSFDWVVGKSAFDEELDRAFDAMLAERMRLLDEQIMNGTPEPPLGIFDEG